MQERNITMGQKNSKIKIVCENRKARHGHVSQETFAAGPALGGTEVKSLRAGRANLKDSFAFIRNGEAVLENVHISPYEHGNIFNHDPLRTRKLLLHKAEITRLFSKTKEKGLTLIPLKIYFARGKAKVELALASGKKNYDKRQAIAEKTAKREIDRALKERQKY